jgi:hypothetical protein
MGELVGVDIVKEAADSPNEAGKELSTSETTGAAS